MHLAAGAFERPLRQIALLAILFSPMLASPAGADDKYNPSPTPSPSPFPEARKGETLPAVIEEPRSPRRAARPIAWRDPDIPISPPPRQMGKQMGRVVTPNIPPLGYEMDGEVKVFRLIAQPVERVMLERSPGDTLIIKHLQDFQGDTLRDVYPEVRVRTWGYNGTSPGPTLECTEGDRIRILFRNELPEPTSIHWHGIELPNHEDGAAGQTQAPVPPGGEFVYEFTLYQHGTFMYHSGYNVTKQDHSGLAGMMVVHPRTPPEYEIDRDFAIMLEQWNIKPGNPYPAVQGPFNFNTFNGVVAPSTEILEVNQGERVRIRWGNLSMMHHPIHVHGYTWWNTGTEGGPIPKSAQTPGNTILVPVGGTRDIEFDAWNPGVWRLHCHLLHHVINDIPNMPLGEMPHGGMFTLIHVKADDRDEEWAHPLERDVAIHGSNDRLRGRRGEALGLHDDDNGDEDGRTDDNDDDSRPMGAPAPDRPDAASSPTAEESSP